MSLVASFKEVGILHTGLIVLRETLKDSLNGDSLLAEHNEDELLAHSAQSMNSGTESNELTLGFCRKVSSQASACVGGVEYVDSALGLYTTGGTY